MVDCGPCRASCLSWIRTSCSGPKMRPHSPGSISTSSFLGADSGMPHRVAPIEDVLDQGGGFVMGRCRRVRSDMELRWAAAASARIALASAPSMILFSVSDSSMDLQMASAACPAAPETLLMASSFCERIGDRKAS